MSSVRFDFTNENYIVTGASSGMGRQIVTELADAGARVLAVARREDVLLELQKEYPQNISVVALDVCDRDAMERAVQNFVQMYGKLYGGVHAAGVLGITPLKMFDQNEAHRIMDISFWAGIDFLQICTKVTNSVKGASFVLFSSADAIAAEKGKFAYSAAKMALNSAVKAIAKEIARRDQRVNTVLPGWVNTAMTQNAADIVDMEPILKRHLLGIGKPEQVSGQVLFLLNNRAAWITGTNVVVDGGYLA